MVGISAIEQGAFVADRYRVVERLTRFAVADSALTGVEYEYWLALDETRDVEVWLQIAASRGVAASGAELAGVVSALRRLNHPALPAVLDFGEIEVEVQVEVQAQDAAEVVVSRVGYVVLEPVEAESLATVLLRAALTEAETFAVLVGIADVLKVLHEVELVHGHLSAYSFLLAERGVLLIDLAAAAALEFASGSELTSAADVYALAWLACIALAGVEAVEAEFGVGFDAGSSPESAAAPQLLTLELVERRRAWAEANLVATYGLRAELAALLVAALGEASGRPASGELAAALRVRAEVVEEVVEAVGVAAAGTAAAGVEVAAVAAVAAAEAVEAVGVAEVVEVAEVAEVASAARVVEETAVVGELVGAGAAVGVGAEAAGGNANRGRGGRGASRGSASGLASAPLTPTTSPSGRHGSPPKRPKSALYVAIGIVVVVVGAVAWGCSAGGSSPSAKPAGTPTTAGQASGGQGGAGSSPSATAGSTAGSGGSPSASAVTSPTAGPNASASAGAGTGGSPTPGYTATPLATAPTSPSQAVQQIQQTVSQAEAAGQIPQQAQGPLNQAVKTLQQEIGSNSSVQQGISELRGALGESGVPAGFRQQINELIPYLSMGQGS